ncbi:hypothetical protein PSEUDT2_03924 [Stutzerimonas stutzeri]|uniref:hypothetical protein n=1 Tax=Stutzerimonas stutzeri TaxID=316 RepID=UPI00117A03C3|nr:hypothetical protein [Stutzerimonas stutzeri]CAD2259585.1 hypothetical protein PSEUDT2_03924 [Stutzerimonas stutzeri]
MAKIIGFIIGHTINIIVFLMAVPFVLVGGVASGVLRILKGQKHKTQKTVRELCNDLAVPDESYDYIVFNRFEEVKSKAVSLDRNDSSTFNERASAVIKKIYEEEIGTVSNKIFQSDDELVSQIITCSITPSKLFTFPCLKLRQFERLLEEYGRGGECFSGYRGSRNCIEIGREKFLINIRTLDPDKKLDSGVTISVHAE